MLDSPTRVGEALAAVGYLPDPATATSVFLAGALDKPLLVEGPAGVGKTQLAAALSRALPAELIRLQCYEGLDEARALYEWDYRKQLLRIQAATGTHAAGRGGTGGSGSHDAEGGEGDVWDRTQDELFGEQFLLSRPLLTAIRRDTPTVLLIDEVDKTDIEVEALLLEVLAEFQVTIPELGTVVARRRPTVVLTSNASRELSEALKRRCLYLYLDYPGPERELDIVRAQVPDIDVGLARQLVRTVAVLRGLELKKVPSVAETVDWARTLIALGVGTLDEAQIARTLGVVLKHESDHKRVIRELGLPVPSPS